MVIGCIVLAAVIVGLVALTARAPSRSSAASSSRALLSLAPHNLRAFPLPALRCAKPCVLAFDSREFRLTFTFIHRAGDEEACRGAEEGSHTR